MNDRPICKSCNKQAVAPNYYANGVRHWRSRCSTCISRGRRARIQDPKWRMRGYKKKTTCDLCGFKSLYTSQITVFHIDGNLNNCELLNLRSICLCCVEVVKRKNLTWRIGEIEADR